MGGKSSSSASSQTTNNQDNRVAVQDGIGLSASSGNVINVTTTTTDAAIVGRALQTVDMSNATLGEGFEGLLSAADNLFARGESLIGQTQKSVADAYGQAQTNKAGTIDNRTIIVLGVAGAVALYAINRKK
jgi:hypothetical protein